MNRLWIRIRMPLAIVAILLMTVALARLFSGPEDTWILNGQGQWVAHGAPAGPPPGPGYHEPASRLFIPAAFLIAFMVPFFLGGFSKPQNRLHYDAAVRDLRWLGYIGSALFLFGALTGIGLLAELAISVGGPPSGDMPPQDVAVMFALVMFSGICILLGAICFVLRRMVNDHYQLMKATRELGDMLRPPKKKPETFIV